MTNLRTNASPARLLVVHALYLVAALVLGPPAAAQPAPATPATEPRPAVSVLDGAQWLGGTDIQAWRKDGSTLVVLPPAVLMQPVLWYTEVVGAPAGTVSAEGLGITSTYVRLERQGPVVHVRDLSTASQRRAAPAPVPPERDPKRRPIEVALGATETGPLIASFPIVDMTGDGRLILDVTATFSNDIPAATARAFIAASGVQPGPVDAARSYVQGVRVSGRSLNIRSHLTFHVMVPPAPQVGPQPVSVVLGHSWVLLPEKPMASRPFDERVGYFWTDATEFETDTGQAQAERRLIQRFRLEKANPQAAVSDPVKPITFYLGRGIPERWKPHVRAGVLQWLPVFEAVGFSNAIRVLDAPTPQQDPAWTEEDVTISVIRWLPQPRVNAMGPHVVDPRSGEVLSAHIQIWPALLEGFGTYYWSIFGGGLDPQAERLPLRTETAGGILAYAVAHEVGHTLGLLHNQLASTAWSVKQLRDPAFANRHGPNSSIMAYGRFNYVAQPGDGVRQFWGVIGPYDVAAIRYGYGSFGTDRASELKALAAFAQTFGEQRGLYFGSQEGPFINRFARDPRVQTENVGAERVEATRLGVANLQRSLQKLEAASGGDARVYASAYATLLSTQVRLLKSVPSVVGAAMPPLGKQEGPLAALAPAAVQKQAVSYLLGEGAASLEPFAEPRRVERVSVVGGYRAVDRLQAGLVADLLNGPNVAVLESQHRRDPTAYSSLDLGRDVMAGVWGPLATATPTQRALQHGFIEAARSMLQAWASGASRQEDAQAAAVQPLGITPEVARALAETGDDTVFIGWLRAALPPLQKRLEAAARAASDETARVHYADMAVQVGRLSRIGAAP